MLSQRRRSNRKWLCILTCSKSARTIMLNVTGRQNDGWKADALALCSSLRHGRAATENTLGSTRGDCVRMFTLGSCVSAQSCQASTVLLKRQHCSGVLETTATAIESVRSKYGTCSNSDGVTGVQRRPANRELAHACAIVANTKGRPETDKVSAARSGGHDSLATAKPCTDR